MITGSIANALPCPLPRALSMGIGFLQQHDLNALELGEHEIMGRRIYVQVLDLTTKPKDECPLESHRRYIDIQCLARGEEKIGFAVDDGRAVVEESKLPGRDIIFYKSVPHEGFIDMAPGTYAVFFPHDIHRPAVQYSDKPCPIRKIVVKVDLDLLQEKHCHAG